MIFQSINTTNLSIKTEPLILNDRNMNFTHDIFGFEEDFDFLDFPDSKKDLNAHNHFQNEVCKPKEVQIQRGSIENIEKSRINELLSKQEIPCPQCEGGVLKFICINFEESILMCTQPKKASLKKRQQKQKQKPLLQAIKIENNQGHAKDSQGDAISRKKEASNEPDKKAILSPSNVSTTPLDQYIILRHSDNLLDRDNQFNLKMKSCQQQDFIPPVLQADDDFGLHINEPSSISQDISIKFDNFVKREDLADLNTKDEGLNVNKSPLAQQTINQSGRGRQHNISSLLSLKHQNVNQQSDANYSSLQIKQKSSKPIEQCMFPLVRNEPWDQLDLTDFISNDEDKDMKLKNILQNFERISQDLQQNKQTSINDKDPNHNSLFLTRKASFGEDMFLQCNLLSIQPKKASTDAQTPIKGSKAAKRFSQHVVEAKYQAYSENKMPE
eukprot:403370017